MIYTFETEAGARLLHSNAQRAPGVTRSRLTEDRLSVEVLPDGLQNVRRLAERCGWYEKDLNDGSMIELLVS